MSFLIVVIGVSFVSDITFEKFKFGNIISFKIEKTLKTASIEPHDANV